MAKTLQELLANRSPESQARIQQMADELLLETQLSCKKLARRTAATVIKVKNIAFAWPYTVCIFSHVF